MSIEPAHFLRVAFAVLGAVLGAARLSADGGEAPLEQWSGIAGGPATAVARVIRSADEWRACWDTLNRPAPRDLDLGREMAVFIGAGERRTGGYQVRVLTVAETDGRFAVRYRIDTPPKDARVVQMITRPWAVAIVPKSDATVLFQVAQPGVARTE